MTDGERLMAAIREFNEEMGKRNEEQWLQMCAILDEDERQYLERHPEEAR